MENFDLTKPMSRVEKLLYALLNDDEYADPPMSRIEAYLLALLKKGLGGGSGGSSEGGSDTVVGEIAANEEVDSMLDEVFGDDSSEIPEDTESTSEVASDEEVAATLNDIFGDEAVNE